jgi:hypothetical protein
VSYGDEILSQARHAQQMWRESKCHVASAVPPIPGPTRTNPSPGIRGRYITRWEEKFLGWAVLDAATADEMGREHVGWFVGNHPGPARVAEQLALLDANSVGGVWVVVPVNWDLAFAIFDKWPHTDHTPEPPKLKNSVWRSRKVWTAAPEDLKRLIPLAQALDSRLAGVIVLDPDCIMYQARGGTNRWGRRYHNDRPQHVVNFRASLGSEGWQPPFLLLTKKPAKSVNTDVVARTFQLEGFRFIAGDSFSCWGVPIEATPHEQA